MSPLEGITLTTSSSPLPDFYLKIVLPKTFREFGQYTYITAENYWPESALHCGNGESTACCDEGKIHRNLFTHMSLYID